MQARYRLYRRSNRSHGTYYAQDSTTGARESLGTKNKAEAQKLLQAKNDAQSQPVLSRELAKVYLHTQDPDFATRTWLDVARLIDTSYDGNTKTRFQKFLKSHPQTLLRASETPLHGPRPRLPRHRKVPRSHPPPTPQGRPSLPEPRHPQGKQTQQLLLDQAGVITVVEAAIARYGAPEHIRSDNGPEFISYAIGDWLEHAKIKTLYIRPGSPGKTVTSKASMTSCATSVSIGSSSAPSLKPESSWKAGAWNTTKPALTARLATRRPESTPGGTTLIFGRPTASLRSGLHQPTKPSTTSTNQPQRNFSFDVSHLRGQAKGISYLSGSVLLATSFL